MSVQNIWEGKPVCKNITIPKLCFIGEMRKGTTRLLEYLNIPSGSFSSEESLGLLHKHVLFIRENANSSFLSCALGITGGKSIKEESDCAEMCPRTIKPNPVKGKISLIYCILF